MKHLMILMILLSMCANEPEETTSVDTGACAVVQSNYSSGTLVGTDSYCVEKFNIDNCIGYAGGFKSCSIISGLCISYINSPNIGKSCVDIGYQNKCDFRYKSTTCP